jgi:hypothetical protein
MESDPQHYHAISAPRGLCRARDSLFAPQRYVLNIFTVAKDKALSHIYSMMIIEPGRVLGRA